MRTAPGKPARSRDPGPYRAIRCPCGHRACGSWLVEPSAAVQGVSFTEEQAEAVAALLNSVEVEDFGGLISFLISAAFARVETLAPDADHRFYLECKLCGGTDQLRPRAERPNIAAVVHGGACSLARHLATLRLLGCGT